MAPRVLMFGWEFPPHNSGGLGTACEGLTRALSAYGVQTIFVLPKATSVDSSTMRFRFAGVEKMKVREVPGLLHPYITESVYARLSASAPAGVYGRNLLEEVKLYALRARQIAEEEEYDVIHAHDWLAYPAGLVAKEVSGKPLVVHVHATEFDRGGGNGVNQQVYEIEKEGLTKADKILAVSEWTRQTVIRHYGVPPEKVSVVHNGIEADAYPQLESALDKLRAAGNKIVLFVGRITLQKGPDYFVRAAARVLRHNPKVIFVVAGSGDMEAQMVRLVADLGLSANFLFPGFLRGDELNRLYQSADLYVLPSVSEPFGITPLESLANGTPVMISKQSGVAEVLSHALKVDFWDIEEMANQIIAVLEHDSLRRTLSDFGRAELPRISWGEAARKCLECYQRLVQPLAVG
jgi:glycosyltransferase involved in cell wall biosynthesis